MSELLTITRQQYDADMRSAAAQALRDLADDLHTCRAAVKDGGKSYIDLSVRAAEIERAKP